MIPSRIDKEDGLDNYRALALYIADAAIGQESGEKTLLCWYSGGETDNYMEGMIEVEATQALNTRTKKPKTYHLILSFRPEDEAKLTPDILKDIDNMMAETLGFSEHQRHSGVHVNTDNPHMHIAFNMIHPRSLKRHAPYFDFPKMHQACRAIEQKYGLAVDEGMEPGCPKKDGLASAKVKRIEAQTGQESLFSYIMRRKPEIMAAVDQAANWPAVHEAFLKYGLILKPSGNGLTIKDRFGKHYAKPSQIDRNLSKGKLCERLGEFEEAAPSLFNSVQAIETYTAIPFHQGPERDNLYAIFQDEMKRRREALDEIKEASARRYADIKERWKLKRQEIKRLPMMKIDRQRLELSIKKREQDELGQMRGKMADARSKIRADIPYTSWGKCLQHKAALGDETALAILRSKKEVIQPDKQPPYITPSVQETAIIWLEKQREIMETPGISSKHRQSLLAIVKMRELIERDTPSGQPVQEFTYSIDTKGTVIFKLSSGGTIRDTGKEIHFSNRDQNAKTLAEKYAKVKWGPLTDITNANVIKIKKMPKSKSYSQER